ncbi:hypothetical protein VE03_06052 [Pseudogymnoascus sp. 23342-1-I1]|nr:hypothetical protein VE03_06052 [Pseudogymnoascus sp. 23342-1-I1]
MVTLSATEASNSRISSDLPAGLVAVFVGATSGIGEYALKEFAKQAKRPKIYFVGRSQDAANRITGELKDLNRTGQYTFIKSDVSLLKNVDTVCEQILAKETTINLLFQTQGTMRSERTSEGLAMFYVLPVTSRILFTLNLLPTLQKANSLKRVVSVFAGGFEGPFSDKDWADYVGKNPMKARPHVASMITMAHNAMARQAPDVTFIHNYPGGVKTNFGADLAAWTIPLRWLFSLISPIFLKYISSEECGKRQLYGATSARFPPAKGEATGVFLADDIHVARGTDGQAGSGSYTINFDGENASPKVYEHLAKAKADGAEERLWAHILGEIKGITGKTIRELCPLYGHTDVVPMNIDDRQLLLWAPENGQKDVMRLLLDNDTKVHAEDRESFQRPLSWTARNGHIVVVNLLLDQNANVDAMDSSGQTPLHQAAVRGYTAIIKLLLENNVIMDINDSSSRTPLTLAVIEGHEVVVKLLLEKKANMDIKDIANRTPLNWAVLKGHMDIIRLLLRKKGISWKEIQMRMGRPERLTIRTSTNASYF